MREITAHKMNGLNEALTIQVLDEPDAGGACHAYMITYDPPGEARTHIGIKFQDGPLQEVGVNGISQEALLAIVIDRLEQFQADPYACDENALALAYAREALYYLRQRTIERTKCGEEDSR